MTDLSIEEHGVPFRSSTAAAIERYTTPCDLIVDLGCGDGRTLVEAIRADRLAIGVERSRRLAGEAREAVIAATVQGGRGFAAVVVGELDDVPRLVGPDSLGKASLAIVDMARVGVLGEHVRVEVVEALERFLAVLGVCSALLRPGGHVVVSARHDLLNEIVAATTKPAFDIIEDRRDAPQRGAAHGQASPVVLRYTATHA